MTKGHKYMAIIASAAFALATALYSGSLLTALLLLVVQILGWVVLDSRNMIGYALSFLAPIFTFLAIIAGAHLIWTPFIFAIALLGMFVLDLITGEESRFAKVSDIAGRLLILLCVFLSAMSEGLAGHSGVWMWLAAASTIVVEFVFSRSLEGTRTGTQGWVGLAILLVSFSFLAATLVTIA